jgi:hypothetical protein
VIHVKKLSIRVDIFGIHLIRECDIMMGRTRPVGNQRRATCGWHSYVVTSLFSTSEYLQP